MNTAVYGLYVDSSSRGGQYNGNRFRNLPLGVWIVAGAQNFMFHGNIFDACSTAANDYSGAVTKFIADNLGWTP